MNTEGNVKDIRNLLLSLEKGDHNNAFFRDNCDGVVYEVERTPSEMSAFLGNKFNKYDELYMTIDAHPSGCDIVITTYER